MALLSQHQFLVLAALLRRPMHPYAIRDEIIQLTGNRVWPHYSTIYGALESLQKHELVEANADGSYWLKARRSTPFTITEQGRIVVRKQLTIYHTVFWRSWERLEEKHVALSALGVVH